MALGFAKSRSAWVTITASLKVPDLTLATTARAGRSAGGGPQAATGNAGEQDDCESGGQPHGGATALEALHKIPGLVVMNDRLSLAGREGLIILLDGRDYAVHRCGERAARLPSSNIERIEVSTQPDASKDAAGSAGVINIILKKNISVGTSGNLILGAGYGRFGKGNAGLDLAHQNTKLSLYGNYSYTLRKATSSSTRLGRRPKPKLATSSRATSQRAYLTDRRRLQPEQAADGRRIAQAYCSSVLLNGYTTRTTVNAESGTVAGNGARVVSDNDTRRRTAAYAANMNYKLQLDTLGRELTADANYSRYQNRLGSDIANAIQGQRGNSQRQVLRNDQDTDIELQNARVDYVAPLHGGMKLGLGVKINRAAIQSHLELAAVQNGGVSRTDDFRYSEQIHAGYGQLEGSGNRWELAGKPAGRANPNQRHFLGRQQHRNPPLHSAVSEPERRPEPDKGRGPECRLQPPHRPARPASGSSTARSWSTLPTSRK